jgi:aryl-alcohol dehydrogenase-like predicted oxidoreductase
MRYRRLGRTGLRVSEISFGAWAIGGPFCFGSQPIGWGAVNDEDSIASLRTAFEHGVNFVDTADIYGLGHSEELVRKAMNGAPQEISIATKGGFLPEPRGGSFQDFSREHLFEACEASLQRLGCEAIHLYQLHCPPSEVLEREEVFEVLDELKRQGKILHYGVSIERDTEAITAMEYPGVETVQIIFNMFRQKPARTVFPLAMKQGVGILARVPLASGLLAGKFTPDTVFSEDDHRSSPIPGETFSGIGLAEGVEIVEKLRFLEFEGGPSLAQIALRWVLAFDAVSATIPGAKTPQQVKENVATSGGEFLSDPDMDRIHSIYRRFVAPLVEEQW